VDDLVTKLLAMSKWYAHRWPDLTEALCHEAARKIIRLEHALQEASDAKKESEKSKR
jgi:hypothetical protein